MGAELLQVRHLSSPEEELGSAEPKHVLVLGAKQPGKDGGHLAEASLFFVLSCNFKSLSVVFLHTLMSLSVRFLQVCTLSGSTSLCCTRTR